MTLLAHDTASTISSANVEGAPLELLVDYIMTRYHDPLRETLWRVDELATQVEAGGGSREVAHLVRTFARNLRTHLMKEEMVLFPAIRARRGRAAARAIGVLETEHRDIAQQLQGLRALTDDFTLPAHASHLQVELYERLMAIDIELAEHIRLESEVLFRRALTS